MGVYLSTVRSYDRMGISLRHLVKHILNFLTGFSEHGQPRIFGFSSVRGNVTLSLGAVEIGAHV